MAESLAIFATVAAGVFFVESAFMVYYKDKL